MANEVLDLHFLDHAACKSIIVRRMEGNPALACRCPVHGASAEIQAGIVLVQEPPCLDHGLADPRFIYLEHFNQLQDNQPGTELAKILSAARENAKFVAHIIIIERARASPRWPERAETISGEF